MMRLPCPLSIHYGRYVCYNTIFHNGTKWLGSFTKDYPVELFCPFGTGKCNAKPNNYYPQGMHVDPSTGDIILGFDNFSLPRTFPITENLEQWVKDNSGNYLLVSQNVLTSFFTVEPFRMKAGYGYPGQASRFVGETNEYHVCVGDTLAFEVATTKATPFGTSISLKNTISWETTIDSSRTYFVDSTSDNKRIKFEWIPDSSDARSEPFKYFVQIITENHPGKTFSSHVNSRTFKIYVHQKQYIPWTLDSLICNRIYCHSSDSTLDNSEWNYNWKLSKQGHPMNLNSYAKGEYTTILASDSGSYELELYASSNKRVCTSRYTDTLQVGSFIRFNTLHDTTLCLNDTLKIEPIVTGNIGVIKYDWRLNGSTSTDSFFNSANEDGLLHLNVSDNRCTWQDSMILSHFPQIEPVLAADTTLCKGDSLWLYSPSTVASISVLNQLPFDSLKVVAPDTIKYAYLDTNGCSGTSSYTLNAFKYPEILISYEGSGCDKDQHLLRIIYDTIPILNPVWTHGSETQIGDSFALIKDYSLPVILEYDYSTSIGLCSGTVVEFPKYVLKSKPLFNMQQNGDTICITDLPRLINFTADMSGKVLTPDSLVRFDPELMLPSPTKLISGPYSLFSTFEADNGCQTADSIVLFVEHADSLSQFILSDHYCFPGEEISLPPKNLSETSDLQWFVNDTIKIPNYTYLPDESDLANGEIWLSVQSKRSVHCKDAIYRQLVLVRSQPMAKFEFSDSIGCEPLNINLTSLQQSNTHIWFINDELSSTSISLDTALFAGTYVIFQIVRNDYCTDTSTKALFHAKRTPNHELSVFPKTADIRTPKFEFSVNKLQDGETIDWFSSDGQINQSNPWTHSIYSIGSYWVEAHITSSEGCSQILGDSFYVIQEPRVYLLNSFTPNGDGINDIYHPAFNQPSNTWKMEIFNRWGERMYSGTEVDGGWNGYSNGTLVESGVYIYTLKLNGQIFEEPGRKGYLVLIR